MLLYWGGRTQRLLGTGQSPPGRLCFVGCIGPAHPCGERSTGGSGRQQDPHCGCSYTRHDRLRQAKSTTSPHPHPHVPMFTSIRGGSEPKSRGTHGTAEAQRTAEPRTPRGSRPPADGQRRGGGGRRGGRGAAQQKAAGCRHRTAPAQGRPRSPRRQKGSSPEGAQHRPPPHARTHTRSPLRAAPGPAAPPLPAVAGPGGRGRPSPLSRRWPGHGGGRRRRSRGRCRRRHHRRRHRRRLPLRRGAGGALRRGESSPACAAVGGGGGAQQLGGKGKGEGRGPREGSDSPSSRAPRRPAGHFVCVPQCSAARGGGAKGRAGPRVCACAVSAVGGARREWSSGGRSGAPRERAGSAAGARPYARVGRGCASAGSNACVRGLELCTWDTAVDACMRARSGTVHPQARVAASSQAVRACINREHALIRSVHTEHLSACMKGPRMCMPATPVHACMNEPGLCIRSPPGTVHSAHPSAWCMHIQACAHCMSACKPCTVHAMVHAPPGPHPSGCTAHKLQPKICLKSAS